MGEPALMMSPQGELPGMVKPSLVQQRDEKYGVSTAKLGDLRVDITGPTFVNPNADYWIKHKKGFAIDVVTAEMKKLAPFP